MLRLKKIEIENYRSVKSESIEIKEIAGKMCFMLFGVNEVGKSNFLNALKILNESSSPNYEIDCFKESLKKQEPICVRYVFSPDEEFLEFLEKIIQESSTKPEFAYMSEEIALESESITRNEIRALPVWKGLEKKFINRIVNNIDSLEISVKIRSDGSRSEETSFSYRNEDIFKDAIDFRLRGEVSNNAGLNRLLRVKYQEKILKVALQRFNKVLSELIQPEVLKERIKIIYWKSDDKYLITNPVDLNNFKSSPEEVSIPLRNMFNLIGVPDDNIPNYIDKMLDSPESKEDFEDDIKEKITSHINELWKGHEIEITARIEGSLCSIHVKDKDPEFKRAFSMEQRSDGFKQFISILLNLSIESRKGNLENALIILDEPENHLHPSGVKCLKEELLKISEKNIIILGSHSIYLVDKLNLDRNKIVIKEHGETKLKDVDKDSPLEEEVVYEALGTSIFEIIEPNILLFEGSTDREAYDKFVNKFKDELSPPKIRTCSATGTSNMYKYAKFFKSKFVNGFMAIDSDDAGKQVKNKVNKEEPEISKNVIGIKDIVYSEKKETTLEDLFPKRISEGAVKDVYGKDISIKDYHPVLSQIKEWKKKNSLQNKDGKLEELKSQIVKKVLKDIKEKDKNALKEEYSLYYEYVKGLLKRIKAEEENSEKKEQVQSQQKKDNDKSQPELRSGGRLLKTKDGGRLPPPI